MYSDRDNPERNLPPPEKRGFPLAAAEILRRFFSSERGKVVGRASQSNIELDAGHVMAETLRDEVVCVLGKYRDFQKRHATLLAEDGSASAVAGWTRLVA